MVCKFCVRLPSFTLLFLKFIHPFGWYFYLKYWSTVWIYHILFIYSPADGHLRLFSILRYYEQSHQEHSCVRFAWVYVLISLSKQWSQCQRHFNRSYIQLWTRQRYVSQVQEFYIYVYAYTHIYVYVYTYMYTYSNFMSEYT